MNDDFICQTFDALADTEFTEKQNPVDLVLLFLKSFSHEDLRQIYREFNRLEIEIESILLSEV